MSSDVRLFLVISPLEFFLQIDFLYSVDVYLYIVECIHRLNHFFVDILGRFISHSLGSGLSYLLVRIFQAELMLWPYNLQRELLVCTFLNYYQKPLNCMVIRRIQIVLYWPLSPDSEHLSFDFTWYYNHVMIITLSHCRQLLLRL